MKKLVLTAVVITLLGVFWYFIYPSFEAITLDEEIPQTKEVYENGLVRESLGIISEADLVPNAHDVKGRVYLIESIDGQTYLRFENFQIINGPSVKVLLSKDFEGEDFIEIGKLKATHGSFNYIIPENVNLETYSKVLVWSEGFNILFAFADFEK